MDRNTGARATWAVPFMASALMLGGCVSSPTYGTGKSSGDQLASDLSGILSIAPKQREPIDYKPRPELVRPSTTTVLPDPQENVVTAATGQWPESPEQQRARIRANATENRDKPGFEPEVIPDGGETAPAPAKLGQSPASLESGLGQSVNEAAQRAEVKRRLAETRQGSATTRKYLSEPPLVYREPNATAPADDLGEDEFKKDLRRKAEARKAAGKSSWRDYVPGI